jgi:tellurite resistance protein
MQETKKDTLLRKLITELQRYQSKEFLKAAMAVCALTAIADGEVSLSERYSIDQAIANEPALRPFDTAKAVRILDDYIFAIREEAEVAKRVLYDKVRCIADDPKQARTPDARRLPDHRCRSADSQSREGRIRSSLRVAEPEARPNLG